MTKIDLKKEYAFLFKAKVGKFDIIEVPQLLYLQIDGYGDPNTSKLYVDAVSALYGLAYTIKFQAKKDGQDFVVPPLDGLWYAKDMGVFMSGEKSSWDWTMMLLMPDFVTEDLFKRSVAIFKAKKNNPLVDAVRLAPYAEGTVVQTLYFGSYSDEGPTIAAMHAFVKEQGYALAGKHHEIYFNDPRKVDQSKLKTIIRQPIAKK